MKTLLLLVGVILISFSAVSFAQGPTSMGVYRLSGIMGYSQSRSVSSNINDPIIENTSLSFAPGYSYFAVKNLELGLQLSFNYNYNGNFYSIGSQNSSYTTHMKYFAIEPNVRYYMPMNGVIPFLGAGISFSSNSSDGLFSKIHYSSFSLNGGADFMFSRNFAVEPSLSYSFLRPGNNYSGNQFQLKVGLNYFIF